uniref:RING-type domain-containing protein n=1 Tax=Onchocerca volvulus TaxID=6282 RepID=A0A8R1XRI0_ONCVO
MRLARGHMASTFIETVNINLEDFSETFLTCATCLYTYDQERKKAKLLPCSHTVCCECLLRMEQLPQVVETGIIRCPLCREMITLPFGGSNAFPSSFLINQLLDLMQKQRKDVVPNCSIHQQEQLLYCEACDLVFCQHCSSSSTRNCSDHTVIPFSIAIKRLSEIVVYKANQCVANLNTAAANVKCETLQLDRNVDNVVDGLNAAFQLYVSFQEICQLVENRRRELIDAVRVMRDEKQKVLRDQTELIDSYRKKLERELGSCQVDVSEIGARTKRVMAATEEALALTEPRENAFLKLHMDTKKILFEIEKSLSQFGAVSGSTTFPGQCVIELLDTSSICTETHLILTTYDVTGKRRNSGGDPVKVEIVKAKLEQQSSDGNSNAQKTEIIDAIIKDEENGTYSVCFKAYEPREYLVRVTIFGRPIKNSPFSVNVSSHHCPKWHFGSHGAGAFQLNQPVKIFQDLREEIYILDTGNNRIKVLDVNGEFLRDIRSEGIKGGSTVGMTVLPSGDILTLNWRTKELYRCDPSGELLQTMSFTELEEPVDLCIDSHGRYLIADTARVKVFVFDSAFHPLFSFNVTTHVGLSPITCVCVGLNDDILVGTCSALLLYDGGGRFIREIFLCSAAHPSRMMALACSVCSQTGNIVSAVVDSKKNRAYLVVCQYKGNFLFSMDSYGSRLKRPCGVFIASSPKWNGMCFVVDSATHSVKAFNYK